MLFHQQQMLLHLQAAAGMQAMPLIRTQPVAVGTTAGGSWGLFSSQQQQQSASAQLTGSSQQQHHHTSAPAPGQLTTPGVPLMQTMAFPSMTAGGHLLQVPQRLQVGLPASTAAGGTPMVAAAAASDTKVVATGPSAATGGTTGAQLMQVQVHTPAGTVLQLVQAPAAYDCSTVAVTLDSSTSRFAAATAPAAGPSKLGDAAATAAVGSSSHQQGLAAAAAAAANCRRTLALRGPCCHCGTTISSQWRSGPLDKPVLCNACGLYFRKVQSLPDHTCHVAGALSVRHCCSGAVRNKLHRLL
jgi:hypothetical protein